MVPLELRNELMATIQSTGSLRSQWEYTGIQTRGFGSCYPGPPASTEINYEEQKGPPSKYYFSLPYLSFSSFSVGTFFNELCGS
jgi:hypothetical protein